MRKICLLLLLLTAYVAKSQLIITDLSTYSQDFNTLASSGTTASTLPAGWIFLESGTSKNTTYSIGTGTSNTADTYSFGSTAATDRAFGGLLSGNLIPTIGFQVQNNSGQAIASIKIKYRGEEWRLGVRNRIDQLDFQYSADATSLSTGTWTDENSLDFTTPDTAGTAGSRDGNAVGNFKDIEFTITGLNIANGALFWIRWTDMNPSGSDDGLAVDDFSMAFTGAPASTDVTAPTITSTTPANMATGVATGFTATATFSEAITKGIGNILVKKLSDNSTIKTIDVAAATVSGDKLSFSVDGLAENTAYFIEMASGVVEDAAGNNFAGITSSSTWGFTTTSTTDTEAPTAPTSLVAANITKNSAALSWAASTDNVGVASYNIYKDVTSIGTANTTSFAVSGLTPATTYKFTVTALDAAGNESAHSNMVEVITPSPSPVVINEVYGGGGNSGATYKNDFVELYNNGNVAVTMTDWSIQYAAATGMNWGSGNLKTIFSGTIPAKGYFLIQLAVGNGGTTSLPAPDATGGIPMGGSGGKVVLCNNSSSVEQIANPTDANIIDKVGYGSSANGFETEAAPSTNDKTSAQRKTSGVDTDNNKADFEVADPTPINSKGNEDTEAPTIISTTPANMAIGVATNFTATATFSEIITKGTGNILVKKFSGNSIIKTIDVAAATVSGDKLSFSIDGLELSTEYYIEIVSGAVKDAAKNNFGGITGSSGWKFTTSATPPMGVLGTAYNFNTCNSALIDGFTAYSAMGTQVWGCTTYGNSSNGVQINGYDASAGGNVANEDWLISPVFDLSATNYPLLEFMSRTKFNGPPLALKISTDYGGTGSPAAATWVTLNGKFPRETSDVWAKSENIDLSAYKAPKVYIAFVYFASSEDGARWTLDDMKVHNSATPPPAVITSNTTGLNFNYVATNSSAVETVLITAGNITSDLSISANGSFTISLDGMVFTSAVTIPVATANNTEQKIFVKFAPTTPSQNYTGVLTANSTDKTLEIALKGNTYNTAGSLEVVNWNVEWFGSTSNGPSNEAEQKSNVVTILKNIGADIYGLLEIVDETALADVVRQIPGYAYKIADFASHTNPKASGAGPLGQAQKLAFVYKTDIFTNIETSALATNAPNTADDLNNPAYNYFASGRYPYMMKADVTLNGETKTMRFVLLHGKANTSPTTTSYNRRKNGSDTLHTILQSLYPNDNIIIFGDINDDLDNTITDGITPPTTSYSAFTADAANFDLPTLALSLAGKKSTVAYNDVIDHVIISNEMKEFYLPESASILTDVAGLVSSYGNSTSDHYPVITRYVFTTKQTICSGAKTAININGNAGQSAKYKWKTFLESGSATGFSDCETDCGNIISQTLNNTSSSSDARVRYAIVPINTDGSTGDTINVFITIKPAPNVASGTFKGLEICVGEQGKLSFDAIDATYQAPYKIKYKIKNGNEIFEQLIVKKSLDTFNIAVNPAATTEYILVSISSAAGCERLADITDSTATITINPMPKAVTGSYGPVCKNTSAINLSGMPVGGVWKGNGISGNSFDPAAGTQLLTYVYTSLSGCVDSAKTQIEVKDILAGNVSAGSYNSICPAGSVQLKGEPAGGAWSGVGVEGNTFFGKNGTQSISYSVKDANECVSVSNTVVNVLSAPVGSAISPAVCSGSATDIFLQSSLSPSGFAWTAAVVSGSASGFSSCSFGCGNQINQVLYNSSNSSNATVRYTVTPTSQNGCAGASFNVDVVVTPLPNVTSSGFKGNTICVDDAGWLSFDAVNASFSSPYEIKYTDGVDTATQIISTPDVTQFQVANSLPQTSNYTLLQIQNGAGCIRSASFGDSEATIKFDPPAVSAGRYGNICSNGPFVLLSGSPFGGEWSGIGVTGANFNPDAGSQAVTYTYVDGEGCKGVDTAFINVLQVRINSIQIETVSNISCNDTVKGSIDLTAEFYSNNGKVVKSYKWVNSNNYDTVISTSEDLINVSPGKYMVEIQAEDFATHCSSTYGHTVELGSNATKLTAKASGTITVDQGAPAAPKVSFSGSGGFGPYTFKYTVNNGAVKTIKGTPNAVVAHDADSVGVFVYKLFNVQDSLGCSRSLNDSATITVRPVTGKDSVKKELNDLVPSLLVLPSITRSNIVHTVKIDVYQIGNIPSSGKITLKINKKHLTGFKFDSAVSNLFGFFTVNNGDWVLEKVTDPDYYIFSTTKSIPANGVLSLGFETGFDIKSAPGETVELSIKIEDLSGGEIDSSNNESSSILYVF